MHGPDLTPLPRQQASTAQLRALRAAAEVNGDVTIAELARILGGHPNTTRAHLDALTEAGLLERRTAPAHGRGRPHHLYRLTPAGIAALRPAPIAPEYATLAVVLADHISATEEDPQAVAESVGRAWARRELTRLNGSPATSSPPEPSSHEPGNTAIKPSCAGHKAAETDKARESDPTAGNAPGENGTTPDARVTHLEHLFASCGFFPERRAGADGETELLLHTCPLLAAAQANPEVICAVHRGLMRGSLEANGFSSEDVALLPFSDDHGCVVRCALPADPEH
ncbi:MAG: helix-turn-helix domain-containing protein [Bowdeniella nasicola]|nr:helix-turn-helix domain-containing protein [Bowdeniella nasicola]